MRARVFSVVSTGMCPVCVFWSYFCSAAHPGDGEAHPREAQGVPAAGIDARPYRRGHQAEVRDENQLAYKTGCCCRS